MADNKNFLPPSDLAFDSIKDSLKEFMRTKERFKDIDFEGSNVNVLLEVLAQNTWINSHYANMIGAELSIDTAQLRESIVSHAKSLNYLPRSRVSARTQVRIQIYPNDAPNTITVPKGYAVKTVDSASNSLRFITDQPVTITRNSRGEYIANNVTVYEGYVVTENFSVAAGDIKLHNNYVTYNKRFILQSENIDTSSIEVYVQDNAESEPVQYKRANTLLGLEDTSNIFFVRAYEANHYEIEFGDGLLGKALKPNNIIHVSYRDTIGEDGNGLYTFTRTSAIDGYPVIEVQALSRASGGAERESNDSIRYNAVKHYQAQERAVIESDYEILIKTNFPEIQEVNVYGGERVYQYGKVYVVLKPYNIDGIVDDATKSRIVNFLKSKSMVPEPVISDPEYFYLGVNAKVYYNHNLTKDEEHQIRSSVIGNLIDLNNNALSDFSVTVYESDINTALTDGHEAVVGASSNITMIRKWFPERGRMSSLSINLDNPIFISGEANVRTNNFRTIFNDSVEDVVIRDDGKGSLFLHKIDLDGNVTKLVPPIGNVDYETGSVNLTLDVYDYETSIDFICDMRNDDISVDLNKYIVLDQSYVNIELIRK